MKNTLNEINGRLDITKEKIKKSEGKAQDLYKMKCTENIAKIKQYSEL